MIDPEDTTELLGGVDPKEQATSFWGELLPPTLVAILIVIFIRIFIAQPFMVSGDSMLNTFHNSDYLIVDQLSFRFREPERQEVVIFKYPRDPSKFFIKRIIGLPGETVEIIDGKVFITVENDEEDKRFPIEENYIKPDSLRYMKVILDENEYFVMGDNRGASSDSRVWGPVGEELLVGRPYLRLFPFNNTDILPGAVEN